jgi:hypothetical protein
VNSKIAIPIIIVIIIVIVGIIGITNQEITENEIEKPWITSGPFSIEVQEYNLGEKIFMNARNIPIDVKGEVLIFRPTLIQFISPMDGSDGLDKFEGISKDLVSKKKKYLAIQFDGKNKQDFNKYFEPKLSKWKNICSVNDLVGEWVIVFYGTQYKEIHFKILNQTSSWDERTFEAVC